MTIDLASLIEKIYPNKKYKIHPYKSFQVLRIFQPELEDLKISLDAAKDYKEKRSDCHNSTHS